MNCRDIEPLLLTERDGALTSEQRAALEQHVAACPACQQLRARLNEALDVYQTDAANVAIPDIETEWRTLRAQLPGERTTKSDRKRPLAPVIWFGTALAAAAALTLAYIGLQPKQTESAAAPAKLAQAVDGDASTIAYVDQESGWLVVWATDVDASGKG